MPGRKCEYGCNCARHKPNRHAQKMPEVCKAVTSEGRCQRIARTSEADYCNMHYERIKRNGTLERKTVKGGKNKYYRASQARHYARQHLSLEQTTQGPQPAVEPEPRALYFNSFHEKMCIQLNGIGFGKWDGADIECLRCKTVVQIGFWTDSNAVKRALVHAKQNCKGSKLVGVQRNQGTRLQRPKGVR